LLGLLFDLEEGDGMLIRNVRFSELPGDTIKNTAFFINTAVRNLNPTAEMDHETI
jgi:hypothetical protein